MSSQPPSAATTTRASRIRGPLAFGVAAVLVALLTYLGYVGVVGSEMLASGGAASLDCRTPQAFGWEYEAINYDGAADPRRSRQDDALGCEEPGPPAGDGLVTVDGVRIAGWYVPVAAAGPTRATVVLAHGWGSNKSGVLPHVGLLREQYNVVAFDFRGHGQSSAAPTTQGVFEQRDLRAVLDWLAREKQPDRIALLGSSMGGATAVNVAAEDERVDALVLDATHATLAGAIRARMELSGYPLSGPGSWAVLLGGRLRTGVDMATADPVRAIGRLLDTPVLLLHGGRDVSHAPGNADDLLRAAQAAGVPVQLELCPDAGHSGVLATCPAEYRTWVLGFLERALSR